MHANDVGRRDCRSLVERLEDRRLLSAAPALPFQAQKIHLDPLVLEYNTIGEVGDVASFTGGGSNWLQATSFPAATINWGDGQVQQDHISVHPDSATTLGVGSDLAHFYNKPGNYHISVTLSENGQTVGQSTATLRVSRVSPGGRFLSASAHQPFSGSLGTFTTTNQLFVLNSVTTVIDWGDGRQTNADPPTPRLQSLGHSHYQAWGSHTYTKPGTYIIQVETIHYVLVGYGSDKVFIDLVSRIAVK